VTRLASQDTWQLDLPLSSLGIGEYALELDAESGDNRARTVVPVRLWR